MMPIVILNKHKFIAFRFLWGFLLASASIETAMAEILIKSVSALQQSYGDVIRVELSESLGGIPQGFLIQNPPRIVLDLPGVNVSDRSPQEVNQGNIRSITQVQGQGRARLVVNLKNPSSYRTELNGQTLLIALDGAVSASNRSDTPGSAISQISTKQSSALVDSQAIRDIDFKRSSDGSARIVVSLSNPSVGIDVRQQGKFIVADFLKSALPTHLRRKLDVSDFGTPVHALSAAQSGDRVKLVLDLRGAWEHSAYQTDNQFVIEVRPSQMASNSLGQDGSSYQGEKLSLNFQNIEVRALLQVIADFTNFNVVTSDTVAGNLTLRLKDVPWDHALEIILQAKGLGMKKSGNVMWIAPKDELAAKEQVDLESRKKIVDLEQVRTQSFQLNYTKAEDVAKALMSNGTAAGGGAQSTRILSARGSVLFDARTNQLFISDISSKLEEAAMMIAKIDVPVRQVLIEARIVEADDTFGRALGVKLGSTDLRGVNGGVPGYRVGGGNYVTVGSSYNNVGYQTNQGGTYDYANTQFVSLPANTSNVGSSSAASIGFSLFSPSASRFLNLEISALEAEGRGKIVSSPRVVTADQTKALIEQGTQIPYAIASSSGATAVQFKTAALKLEVTPQITPEGSVTLDLDVSKDSQGVSTTAGPAINTKHVRTQVLVENGGTVAIGGIFTQDEREEVEKVPFLGDIPLLGFFFRNSSKYSKRTELLIFITPKIVTDRTAVR